MTTQTIDRHPSPTCPCHDCVTEYVKDWEGDFAIYYADEYTGPFATNVPDFDW